MMSEESLGQCLVDAMQQLAARGLNRGTSGNGSCRLPDTPNRFLITPSGVPSGMLSSGSLVSMAIDGAVHNKSPAESNFIGRKNQIKPSSEWRFHHDILRDRPSVNAVIHVHSPFATSLACLRKEIPPFHYMIAIAGGRTIRCAPYALFGTQELSNHVMVALEGRHACLMANHGMLAVGKTIGDALRITIEVESLCEQYWRALQLGEPYLLSETQMRDVIEKFKTYGPNDSV
jgi:L-fuculose-phosphate aldolase